MKMGSRKLLLTKGAAIIGAAVVLGTLALPSKAVVTYDDNVTPDLILGSGNSNGSFTVDRASGVEIGLRGKVRFNNSNLPENTYNSNGDGTYSFVTGAPTGGAGWVSATTPRWNFEWSINTDYDDSSGWNLDDLTYELRMDFDASSGTASELVFDPIHDAGPGPGGSWDHSIGDNSTPNGGGAEAVDGPTYAALITGNNVAQQSWNYEFFNDGPYSSFDPNEPGTYTVSLAAYNGATQIASTSIQIVVGTQLVVETADDWCGGKNVGDTVTVDIYLQNANDEVAGGQFLVAYNADYLDLVSVAGGAHPFTSVFFELSNPLGDTDNAGTDHHFFAVGNPLSGDTTSADTLMASMTFMIVSEFCSESDLIVLEAGSQPIGTYLTDEFGAVVPHAAVDLGEQTVDDTAPVITCPADISVFADAGLCEATVDIYSASVESFDTAPTLSATQAPGVWYTDRYAPFGFTSEFFDGDDRLKHSIDASDCSPCRAGFTSAFYDTQGRKYDTPGSTRMSIDLYIPSDWATTERRMAGFWGTAFDSGAGISGYPIIEFTSTTDGTGVPRFRWYTQAGGGSWVDLGLPTGFAYDDWTTLEIELDGGNWVATVGDITYVDPLTYGTVEIGNVILQGHNNTAGVTYDIYWDNFSQGFGAYAEDTCSLGSITGVRDDFLPLTDPYPAGVTTVITWTATDGCGNTDSCMQNITVSGDNEAVIDLAYDGVLDAAVERCIEFVFSGTSPTQVVTQVVLFDSPDGANTNARANGVSVPVPCGIYDCLTVRDPLHSLASSVDLIPSGPQYIASATGVDAMPGGNLNGDLYIDILDFGVFVGQYGDTLSADTDCSTLAPHSDITGDTLVGSGDFGFISGNFLQASDTGCTALVWNGKSRNPAFSVDNNGGPVTRISVAELQRRGLGNLVKADLNNDQWLDQRDVAAFLQGARP